MKISALVAFLVLAISCDNDRGGKPDDIAAPVPPLSEPAPAPAPPPPPTLAEQLAAEDSFDIALALTKPAMEDSTNEISAGALLFAYWAAQRMRWPDINFKDETSIKLVKKDSDAARGKRMCYSGSIVQITKQSIDEGVPSVFIGLLRTRGWDILHFIAVGSTGALVEDSRARFCGVVTGTYSYSNSGGGTTHAVQLVGMFKLRENENAERMSP